MNNSTSSTPRAGLHVLSSYSPALKELGLVLCRSLFLPLVIGMAAWELRDGYDTSSLSGSICRSAFLLLPAIWLTRILTRSLRSGGLAKRFFNWSSELIRGLRHCVNMVQWFVLPLQFLYVTMQTFEQGKWNDSLGRLFFVGSMIALGVALWRASRQLKNWRNVKSDTGSSELATQICRWGVLLLAIAPLVIGAMAVMGYQYGAEQMGKRLLASILLTMLTVVMTGFLSHILLVTQFKIKYRRLIANRESVENRIDTDAIDIKEISLQVNRLLSVFAIVVMVITAWNVWGSVFPANSYLDQVQLWKGPLNDAGESPWITLRDVLSGVVVAVLTMVLSRNLPGLLEITLLDRLPLDRGGRYAISFVCRYVVGIIGILLTCQLLGFSWKGLQWLAAGLTVGLGFGLQEIFANLVSGIIILIERPIRVGDFVTVNGTSGTVIRMQLRATTIQDPDNRELIVPNKKFITEDVMNWTLTNSISRAVFTVGVAYGSDTELVVQTLLAVASENPLVVRDPKPMVVFSNFGDSTLNFELRVHIPNREVYPQVQHQLHMQIDKAFREANIEIAFPQQEIHLDDRSKKLVQQVLDTIDAIKGAPSPASGNQPQSESGNELAGAANAAAMEAMVSGVRQGISFKRAG